MKKTILFFLMLSSLIFGSINSEYVDAFEIGDISLIKKLLNKGANINTINYEGSSALTLALKNNRRDLAKFLIEKGINVNLIELTRGYADEVFSKSAFIIATEQNDIEMMELLLKKGAKISYQKGCDESPLMVASEKNNLDAVLFLIEKGANVNERVGEYQTPLINAACYDAVAAIKILIEKGADIEAKSDSKTALLWALDLGLEKTALFLINEGANVNIKDKNGFTALHYAAKSNLKNIVKLLISKGLDINYKNSMGDTPLHLSDLNLIPLLVENGANINDKNLEGYTKLHLEALKGNTSSIEYLLNQNADIDSLSNELETPLMFALDIANWKVAKILLDNGADCNLTNINGLSPFAILIKGSAETYDIQEDWRISYFKENQTDYYEDLIKVLKILISKTKEKNTIIAEYNPDYEEKLVTPVLIEAGIHENKNLFDLLIKNGININLTRPDGVTSLMVAAYNGWEDSLKMLLERGASVNEPVKSGESEGETALTMAVSSNNKNIVKILVAHGAKSLNGKSVLSLAQDYEMENLLIKLGIK